MQIMKQTTRKPAQSGVMLLEVLVSILIFSFGILGMVGMHARAAQFSTNAEDRNRASLLANEIASAMWVAGSTTLTAATIESWQTRVSTAAAEVLADNSLATPVGLPGGSGSVTVDGAGVATILITWRATFDTADNRFVTQVVVP